MPTSIEYLQFGHGDERIWFHIVDGAAASSMEKDLDVTLHGIHPLLHHTPRHPYLPQCMHQRPFFKPAAITHKQKCKDLGLQCFCDL